VLRADQVEGEGGRADLVGVGEDFGPVCLKLKSVRLQALAQAGILRESAT